MPYIPKEDREYYDHFIGSLCTQLTYKKQYEGETLNPGHLNYIVTRLCKFVFEDKPSYKTLALITGVLENVKQELYRRQFADYEDAAIKKNGDL